MTKLGVSGYKTESPLIRQNLLLSFFPALFHQILRISMVSSNCVQIFQVNRVKQENVIVDRRFSGK